MFDTFVKILLQWLYSLFLYKYSGREHKNCAGARPFSDFPFSSRLTPALGIIDFKSIFDIDILYFLFIECIGAFTFLNEYRIWSCLYFFSAEINIR